jgi:DNA topoisomerase VI subunit B
MIFGNENAKIEMSEVCNVMESGIGDIGIVFQILSGLYNDPQRIIVQEYIANARDAQREVGNGDVAIEVTLPTPLNSELKIRDFGPGISPDRMENIFINYGASTKRGDNIQTGAFGIGAKSVFCYTDTCTIETWVDGIYYNYCYMVGDDKKPKCVLMSSQESNEPNGTRISNDCLCV